MTRAWWAIVGGAILAPLVSWLPMLTLLHPGVPIAHYQAIQGMYAWWDHVLYLTVFAAIAAVVWRDDRWLASAVALGGVTFFLRGLFLTTAIVFALGALLVTVMRRVPTSAHARIRAVLISLGMFQVLYVLHQHLGHDILWAGVWGLPTSTVVQPIGTLGTVDGVSAYLAILAPLMPLWLIPAAIYLVWAGHSLSALLALACGLGLKVVMSYRALANKSGRYLTGAVASLGATAFASMLYLKGPTETVVARVVLWLFGLEWAAKTSPVIGWGLGGWADRIPAGQMHWGVLPSAEFWLQAHNEYVQWAVETGVVGVIIACGWLWTHRRMFLDRTWGGSITAVAVNAVGFFPLHVVPISLLAIICVGLATPTHAEA